MRTWAECQRESQTELKPGEGRFVFRTEEEWAAHQKLMAEIEANPEKYKDYAWEEAP